MPLNLYTLKIYHFSHLYHLSWWLSSKESTCNAGDVGSIPGLGRSPGERNGNPLQYSCLENSMDRGAWWVTVCGVARVRQDLATKQQQSFCVSLATVKSVQKCNGLTMVIFK